MFTVAAVIDSKNHEFLLSALESKCDSIRLEKVFMTSIIGDMNKTGLGERMKAAGVIRKWIESNSQYDAVLIFSDYNFGYRTFVHYCRKMRKPVFLFQDGYILFEPWPWSTVGLIKRAAYQAFNLLGYSHLISYKSFHTRPNRIFTWGDYFSRLFKATTSAEAITVGCLLYERNFSSSTVIAPDRDILFYGTFYRDLDKDLLTKDFVMQNLEDLLKDNSMTCEIKLHPLDKNKGHIEELIIKSPVKERLRMIQAPFSLHEHLGRYKMIISEFSTETVFASMFSSDIFFIRTSLNENHFSTIGEYLSEVNLAGREFYRITPALMDKFRNEYFKHFDANLFQKSIQGIS